MSTEEGDGTLTNSGTISRREALKLLGGASLGLLAVPVFFVDRFRSREAPATVRDLARHFPRSQVRSVRRIVRRRDVDGDV